jgi:hypothetical protein
MSGSHVASVGVPRVRAAGLGETVREQSTAVAVLVVVVVVLVVGGAGAVFVFDDSSDGTDQPQANLSVDVTAESVTVTHDSGDTVDPADVRVTVIADSGQSELDLTEFDDQPADPGSVSVGDQFTNEGGPYVGNVTVLVLHEPTSTRLVDETVTVEPALGLTIDGVAGEDGGAPFVGEPVTATFTLDNQGASEAQDVVVTFDGEIVFDETVTVEAGTTVTETVTAGADLAEGLDVEVTTDEESAGAELGGPAVEVGSDSVPVSSPADIDYTVENTGDIGTEQEVTLESTAANGTVLDERATSERVASGETVEGTFTAVGVGAGGELALSVADGETSLAVPGSEFQVVGFEAPDEVAAGEDITAAYEVENQGEFQTTQDVAFSVGGTTQDTERLTLAGGETVSGEFTYTAGADAAPGVTVGVSTADDSASTEVSVAESVETLFTVDIVETNAPMAGTPLEVTAALQNAGEQAGTRTITLDVAGLGTNATEVTLDGGAATQVTLSVATGVGDIGTYTATVTSDDDEESVQAEVTDAGSDPVSVFEVVGFDAPATVDAGGDITVTYEVENTGNGGGTQEIAFLVGGSQADAESGVSLEPGETVSGQFTAGADGAGATLTVAVSTDDDSASAEVEISQDDPSGGDLVASLGGAQGSVGEIISVDLTVVSVDGSGDEFGSYTIVLSYDDSVLEFQGLSPGEWGSPANANSDGNLIAVTDFDPDGSTPAEPALSFEFKIVSEGTAAVEFTDTNAVPGENRINDGSAEAYDTIFEDGLVETT